MTYGLALQNACFSGLIEAVERAFFTSAAAVAAAMPKALKSSTEEGFASVMNAGWV